MPAAPTRNQTIIAPPPKAAHRPPSLDPRQPHARTRSRVQNRIRIFLVHLPRLSIRGQARLASEIGVSRSTISRLVNGHVSPSYRLAEVVTEALSKHLGERLDPRDIFSTDGSYPHPSGCALCHCSGCLPDEAYDPEGNLRVEWRGQHPGDWSYARPMTEVGEREAAEEGALEPAGKEGK